MTHALFSTSDLRPTSSSFVRTSSSVCSTSSFRAVAESRFKISLRNTMLSFWVLATNLSKACVSRESGAVGSRHHECRCVLGSASAGLPLSCDKEAQVESTGVLFMGKQPPCRVVTVNEQGWITAMCIV